MRLRALVHPDAGVGHLHEDVAAGLRPRMRSDEGPAERDGLHGDAERAAGRHGVAGVRGEVEQDLLDLDPVGQNAGHLCGSRRDRTTMSSPTRRRRSATASDATSARSRGAGCTSARRLKASSPRVSWAARSAACSISRTSDRLCVARRVLGEVEFGEPADGRQEVVEVVGHAAREPPDRLHLGGLPKPRLEL